MQFGFGAPVSGSLARPENLARIAVEGEAIGYDYATISDHVVIPRDIEARYPYSDTGEFPGRSRGDRHEQLIAVAFIAGKTARLRLVTSVTVVPHRPAVLLAKMLATIDVLSNGRLTFGIGAGWMREEFEALGVPPFAERGHVTDEYLMACRELWTKDDPRFEGKYVKFANVLFEPKPVQRPHPPIWVGGESGPALRRTARLGDGWYPIGTNPQHRLDSMKRFAAGVERLRRLTREAGRDPSQIALAYRVTSWGRSLPARADDGERRLFSGETAAVVADLKAFADLGVGHVDFSFDGDTADAMIANMRRFREDVLAKV
ncbi:MAG TPA: LLM class F420-dependent oxidoreductase [Stellaceae bacterium]|jgi:probable F420-dependent oxidoreductase|nr:LLM class F420-dependent oxidoreductase [Stellaceae bacterium]